MRNPMTDIMIDEALAKKLSDLLSRQSIRMDLLVKLVNTNQYDDIENSLIDINAEIDAIKMQITETYIPERYRHEAYEWVYNGYAIDENTIHIYAKE